MNLFGRSHDKVESLPSGLHVEAIREDPPAFRRVYTAKLNIRASIKITMHTFLGSRMTSGELTQPNGRWVLFEPERVADKILDRDLVPLVESHVAEAFRLDRAFINSDPSEFIDQHGARWKRMEA